jgi:glycosyltransferase involved in cell wall biosynthesis
LIGKIVVVESHGVGGLCHYTYNLCNALSNYYEDIVLVTTKKYELEDFKINFKIERLFEYDMRYFNRENLLKYNLKYPRSFIKLLIFLTRERAIIHFQNLIPPLVISYAFLILIKMLCGNRSTLLLTAHDVLPHDIKFYHKYISKLIYKLMDGVIVHSEHSRRELIGMFGIEPTNVHVIPHGDYFFFRYGSTVSLECARKKLCLPSGSLIVLFFGFIMRYKGLDYLLEAFRKVKNVVPNVKAIPYVKTYQSGIIMLAYSFNKPVVSTDTGGVSGIVVNGETGYVVPPKDVQALANALIDILSNQDRAIMGENAKKIVGNIYSWSNAARETLKLYSRFIRERGELSSCEE